MADEEKLESIPEEAIIKIVYANAFAAEQKDTGSPGVLLRFTGDDGTLYHFALAPLDKARGLAALISARADESEQRQRH